MKKKTKRILLTLLLIPVILTGLFLLFTSSYAVCSWYLPALSRIMNIKFTAQDVDWHIQSRRVTFRNFSLTLPDDVHFSARTMRVSISYADMLRGLLSLEKIQVLDAEVFFSGSAAGTGGDQLRYLDRIRIGRQDFHNLVIRGSRKNSGAFFRIALDYLHGSPVRPHEENRIQLRSGIVWQTDNTEVHLPLNGEIVYRTDEHYNPLMLKAFLQTEEPDVNIYDTKFSGLRLTTELDAARDRTTGTIQLNKCEFSVSGTQGKALLANLHGTYSADAFDLTISAETGDTVSVLNNVLPVPLKQSGSPLAASFRVNLAGEQNCFSLRDLFTQIRQDGKTVLRAETTGTAGACLNPDQTWTLLDRAAEVRLSAEKFPTAVLENYLPCTPDGGELTAEYRISTDPQKKMLSGSLSGNISGLTLYRKTDRNIPLFTGHTIRFKSSFHSEGLVNLKGIRIPEFTVSAEDGGGIFTEMKLNGECDLIRRKLHLSGTALTDLHRFLRKIANGQLPESFLKGTQNNSHVRITVDLPAEKLFYTAKSGTETACLPAPLEMESSGELFFQPGRQDFKLKKFSLAVPEHFLLTASGFVFIPDGNYSGQAELRKLSPDLIRCLWQNLLPTDDAYELELMKKLTFHNISAKCRMAYSGKERKLTVPQAELNLNNAPGQGVRIYLTTPLSGNPESMQFASASGRLQLSDLPMSFCNMFVPDYMHFRFSDGAVNGTAELTFTDFIREVSFDTRLFIDDLSAKKRNIPITCGGSSITGKGAFLDSFRRFIYYDAAGQVSKDGEQILEMTGNGAIDFFHPYKADFYFQCGNITEQYMQRFCDLIRYRKFQADGTFSVHCINNYSNITLSMQQHIREAVPAYPEDTSVQEPELHGELNMNYDISGKDRTLVWRDTSLRFRNADEKTVFHMALAGQWQQKPEQNVSRCKLTSEAADMQLMFLALKGAKEQKRGKKKAEEKAEKKKWIPQDSSEPAALNLADFATMLQVELRNWTYPELLNAELDALFLAENNTFSAKNISGRLNQGTFVFHADADLGKEDGWEIKADGTLNNLNVTNLIECFGTEKLKKKGITGNIDMLRLNMETKGITQASLDRNLKVSGCAEVSDISLPLTDSDTVSVFRVLLLPMTFLPKTIGLIPSGKLRDKLKESMIGDSLDILTGQKNLHLARGQAVVHSAPGRKTDMIFDKLLFAGPGIKLRTKSLRLNPFHNELEIETETYFGGLYYPLDFTGALDQPEISYDSLLKNMMLPGTLMRNLAPELYTASREWQFEDLPQKTIQQ